MHDTIGKTMARSSFSGHNKPCNNIEPTTLSCHQCASTILLSGTTTLMTKEQLVTAI